MRHGPTISPSSPDASRRRRGPVTTLTGDGPLGTVARRHRRRRAAPHGGRSRLRRLGDAVGGRHGPRPLAIGRRLRRVATGRCCTAPASKLEPPAPGERRWVVLDGIFYQADVWLDGAYLGDPEGYFFPHTLRHHRRCPGSVASTCWPSRWPARRRATCAPSATSPACFQHWDCIDPAWNPGGLWRPVRVERDRARSASSKLRVLCRDADERRANLCFHARLDSDAQRTVRIAHAGRRLHRARPASRPLAKGLNEVALDPRHRRPPAVVAVGARRAGADRRHRRGLRRRRQQRPAHRADRSARGRHAATGVCASTASGCSSRAPTSARRRRELGEVDAERTSATTSSLARDAGLDLVRVHGHISRPELYEAADELGMLVWQDFPLQWGYARQIRRQAVSQAREAVDLLGHHPSIVTVVRAQRAVPGGERGRRATRAASAVRRRSGLGQQLPTWNQRVLDRWVKRAFERADDSRPVVAHSGVLPHLPTARRHRQPPVLRLVPRRRARPRRAAPRPCPGWCGSSASSARSPCRRPTGSCDPERWPELDWEHLDRAPRLRAAAVRASDCRRTPSPRSTRGGWRPSSYQAECCATRSRRCGG